MKRNAAHWHRFEELLQTSARALKTQKGDIRYVNTLLSLYASVSTHLSYARTHYPQSDICEYLNDLVSKGHTLLYKPAPVGVQAIIRFYRTTLPMTVIKNYQFLLISTGVFILAVIYSWFFTALDLGHASLFLPAELIDSMMNGGELGAVDWNSPVMTSIIMSNNIQVSFLAFALGIIPFGLGTAYILLVNGLLLGSLSALVTEGGQSLLYWSLILPHGIIELMAIFISGGAGFKVGIALLRPGIYTRKDAVIFSAKEALILMGIVVPMLIVAGLIEGFFTPADFPPALKIAAGAVSGVLVLYYLIHPLLFRSH